MPQNLNERASRTIFETEAAFLENFLRQLHQHQSPCCHRAFLKSFLKMILEKCILLQKMF